MMKFVLFGIGMCLILLFQPTHTQAAPTLPPRPTIAPLTTPDPPPHAEGGWIVLRAALKDMMSAQTVWSVVQWQDAAGEWHNVEGWQGTFDVVVGTVGIKTWWVAPRDLAKGPFRWVIYQERDGAWLAASDTFYLPRNLAETIYITLPLE
jgi:hypothetical protein